MNNLKIAWKACNWKGKISIIKTLLDLPAIMMHEFLHLIVAIITFHDIVSIECNYFL